MSIAIANALGEVKQIVGEIDVSTVGASIFVSKHCSDDEITQINDRVGPQRVERLDVDEHPITNPKTRIDL